MCFCRRQQWLAYGTKRNRLPSRSGLRNGGQTLNSKLCFNFFFIFPLLFINGLNQSEINKEEQEDKRDT
uniref:Uncharacterized protein n=1 Tax=Rhizophora mucronata TaxID=61149 RepID=A0A2P2ILB6_RHIMU